jgi:2,4-dienoyl-CoA reductase-like NADH-dependent reductase (Old Yellow Enzyme family)
MAGTPALFEPLRLGGITLANRIAVSPMCQYSAEEREANDWHLQHLGSLSISGAGLVIVEQWRSNRRAASPRYPDALENAQAMAAHEGPRTDQALRSDG